MGLDPTIGSNQTASIKEKQRSIRDHVNMIIIIIHILQSNYKHNIFQSNVCTVHNIFQSYGYLHDIIFVPSNTNDHKRF